MILCVTMGFDGNAGGRAAALWQIMGGSYLNRFVRHPIIKCILASLLILLFDYFKVDVLYVSNNYVISALEEVSLKLAVLIPYIIYTVYAAYMLIYVFSKAKLLRWKAVAVAAVISCAVLIYLFVPYSSVFAKYQYQLNKDHYAKTIQMLNDGELSYYHAEANTYFVPFRFVSYTRLMYVQNSDSTTKIWFDVYEGLTKSKIIIFAADNSGINENDFAKAFGFKYNYSDIKQIDTNWYSATVRY